MSAYSGKCVVVDVTLAVYRQSANQYRQESSDWLQTQGANCSLVHELGHLLKADKNAPSYKRENGPWHNPAISSQSTSDAAGKNVGMASYIFNIANFEFAKHLSIN
jgi:hypothetical protein